MKYIGVGISLGLCFGAALGAAMHNVAVGVAFSMIFGAASPESLARKKAASDKPLRHPLGL